MKTAHFPKGSRLKTCLTQAVSLLFIVVYSIAVKQLLYRRIPCIQHGYLELFRPDYRRIHSLRILLSLPVEAASRAHESLRLHAMELLDGGLRSGVRR